MPCRWIESNLNLPMLRLFEVMTFAQHILIMGILVLSGAYIQI